MTAAMLTFWLCALMQLCTASQSSRLQPFPQVLLSAGGKESLFGICDASTWPDNPHGTCRLGSSGRPAGFSS